MSVHEIHFDEMERAAIEERGDLPAHDIAPRTHGGPSPNDIAKARERLARGKGDDNDRAVAGVLPEDPSEGMLWEDDDAANESELTRVPPHDLLAERAVVATAAYGDFAEDLDPGDFYSEAYRRVFEAELALKSEGAPVEVPAIIGRLQSTGRLAQCGGVRGVTELLTDTPVGQVAFYGKLVKSCALARRTLFMAQRLTAQVYAGCDPEALITSATTELETLKANTSPGAVPTLWAADLAQAVEPIEWVSRDLALAPGRPNIFAGLGGARKGWLSLDILICGALGKPVLGRFRTRESSVSGLYLDFEQTPRVTRERAQLLALGHGIDLASLGKKLGYRWKPVPTLAPKTTADKAQIVEELCRQVDGFGLVLIDSIRSCSPGIEENGVFASGPLDVATEVSEKTGACFLFLDHAGKGDEQNPRARKLSQRGHSSKLDASQTLFVFTSMKGEPTLVTCERAQALAEGEWPADFQFTLTTSNGGGLRLQEAVVPEKARDHVSKLKSEILEVVRKDPTLTSGNAVCLRIKGNRTNTLQAINELIDSRKLVQPGGKGSPFRVA
jgi:hypothetical protein